MDKIIQEERWKILKAAMETYRKSTGWGLARTWGMVNAGEYDNAVQNFLLTLTEGPEFHAVGRCGHTG